MRYAAVSRNRRCFYTQGGMFCLGGRTFRLLGKEQELSLWGQTAVVRGVGRSWGRVMGSPGFFLRRTLHVTQSTIAREQDPQGSCARRRVPPASVDPTRPDAPCSTQSRAN